MGQLGLRGKATRPCQRRQSRGGIASLAAASADKRLRTRRSRRAGRSVAFTGDGAPRARMEARREPDVPLRQSPQRCSRRFLRHGVPRPEPAYNREVPCAPTPPPTDTTGRRRRASGFAFRCMRFSPPSEPARVAVFAGAEHPLARHAMFYECVDRAVAALGAEAVFVHAELADPAGLPPHLRARLGTGLYVPFALEVEANDLAHFERTAPVRLHRLAEALARHADGTVGEVLAYGEFRQAVHVARWVQGLGASAVLSLGLDAGAFRAFVVSELLDNDQHVLQHCISYSLHEMDVFMVCTQDLAKRIRVIVTSINRFLVCI